jgi:hypothetical protein
MAEFHKKKEREREKANEWVNQFRPNFESTLTRIEKYQERKLFNLEIIALVLFGAFLVNLLSTCIFDISVSFASQQETNKLIIDYVFAGVSIGSIGVIFFYFKRQLKKYLPQIPVLTMLVKPDDIKPFVAEQRFAEITKFLDEGKLTDFKSFSNAVLEHLSSDFCFLFGLEKKKPIKEYEEEATIPNDIGHKDLVTIAKDYDISGISRSGVKVTLQIKLVPKVIYNFSAEGDKTASYSFALVFHFIVTNPEHCDASKLIEEYYLYRAHEIVQFASNAISWSFREIGLEFDWEKKFKAGQTQSLKKT